MFRPNIVDDKIRKTDRVLVLKPMEGKVPKATSGLPDPRLFTGENNLHIVKDNQNNLWKFKLDIGGVPEPLKQTFTTFDQAKKHAEGYYRRRNVLVQEVLE